MSTIELHRSTRSPQPDNPRRGERVRSALSEVFFIALLFGAVGASWLWGPKFSVVLSHSMDPSYTTGDALLLLPWGKPGIGDIAQFRVPLAPDRPETTIPVAHRIIGRDDRGFITKGDNPKAVPDYWRVTPDMIQGEVVWWLPQVWMFRIAAGLIGFAVLVLLWPARQMSVGTCDLVAAGRHRMTAPTTHFSHSAATSAAVLVTSPSGGPA